MAEAVGAFFSLKFMNIKNLGIMHNFLILSKECEKSVKNIFCKNNLYDKIMMWEAI